MEGVSHEAASLAGHQKLDHLIVIFDDNHITIDGSTGLTCSDDVAQRFSSYGWDVTHLGPISESLDDLEAALLAARNAGTGRPQLLILPTKVGFPLALMMSLARKMSWAYHTRVSGRRRTSSQPVARQQ
jgi:transketolase